MKTKKDASHQKTRSKSLQVETLLKEAETQFATWIKDPQSFLQKVQLLTMEEQEDFFHDLFQKGDFPIYPLLEGIQGRDEKIDLVLAQCLAYWRSAQAGEFLHRMSTNHPSKEFAKIIRKSLFRLKTKGIPAEDIPDPLPAVYHPEKAVSAEGFLNGIDSFGSRVVWFTRPQVPQGIIVFQAVVNDLEGIEDFHTFETSRKNFHEYMDNFQKQYANEIIDADPAYCQFLIGEAAEKNQKKGKPLPPEFLRSKSMILPAQLISRKPLIYQYIKEEEIKALSILHERSASLFNDPAYQGWFLGGKECENYLTLLKEASTSRLVLTPYQQEARVMDIYRQAVHELFTAPYRFLLQRRLEEMSYILWKKGKENEAKMSLAASFGLQEESKILSPHPFLLELVKRSLLLLLEEEKKEKEETGLIIKP
jgi:hypothetical protein